MNSNLAKLKALFAQSRMSKSLPRNQFKPPNPQAMAHDMKQAQAEARLGVEKPKMSGAQTNQKPPMPKKLKV